MYLILLQVVEAWYSLSEDGAPDILLPEDGAPDILLSEDGAPDVRRGSLQILKTEQNDIRTRTHKASLRWPSNSAFYCTKPNTCISLLLSLVFKILFAVKQTCTPFNKFLEIR
jgi:hypothetical protein